MNATTRRPPRKRRRKRRLEGPSSGGPIPAPPNRVRAAVLLALCVIFGTVTGSFLLWLGTPRVGSGRVVDVTWPEDGDRGAGSSALAAAEVVDRPTLFRAVLFVASPLVRPVAGRHLLADDLTPMEVLRRLSRLSSRARARVLVPEGWNHFQIAARLEELRVCSRRPFEKAVLDAALLAHLGISGPSAEGYLFPATYELLADSTPETIVTELAREAKKRLGTLHTAKPGAFSRLRSKYAWGDTEILTLASMVEREAQRAEELGLVASVFYNRLDSADFRPARSLQSDPTAAYGCLLTPTLESCRSFSGRVTPAMLRDPANAYNTYRHPGLPPGPIANPGVAAIAAVLEPAETDYLFFVASGEGRHAFTRTLAEHEANVHAGP